MGALDKIISKLRSNFPEKVDAAVLKKLGLASNNESYIINTLRFLGVIDRESLRTTGAHDLFLKGDEEFAAGFADMVKGAYGSLFGLHADLSWTLEKARLISFFRTEDKSTVVVGTRQADTFVRLAELAVKRPRVTVTSNGDAPRQAVKREKKPVAKPKPDKESDPRVDPQVRKGNDGDGSLVSLAVKILYFYLLELIKTYLI
jgi:hypothetical protein